MTSPLPFICPACQGALDPIAPDLLRCRIDGAEYREQAGVWRLIAPGRETALAQFIAEYETVRRGENRGAESPAYYRALPFDDLSGRFVGDWKIRGASYATLVRRTLAPIEARLGRAPVTLDLGAGPAWLAYRLAQRGHRVMAVDLQTNAEDGLGAHVHYDAAFVPVQAEFDRLPFPAAFADLIIFNASLHYSPDYVVTLRESLRVLQPRGALVILDSPLYRDPSSGQAMVREREAGFVRRFGFPSNAMASEQFLTTARLEQLADTLGIRWEMTAPRHGLRFVIRRWKTRMAKGRESARFPILVAQRGGA